VGNIIRLTMQEIEADWARQVGPKRFEEFRTLLQMFSGPDDTIDVKPSIKKKTSKKRL
jgi:hypothetical protein